MLGTFVAVFPDDVVAEVEAAIEDEEALLKAAYFVESRNRLDHLVRLMPRERLRRAVLLALDESRDLMREVASLIVNVSYALKRELGEIAAEQDGDENRRADERDREQHLKRRLGNELNGDHLPVRRGDERAPLEQMLQVHAFSL